MPKKKRDYQAEEDARCRVEIERLWAEWFKRQPKNTFVMMEFFDDVLLSDRRDLLEFKNAYSDNGWQQVKYWLLAYDERAGP